MSEPWRQIRAVYDDDTITVYQAYGRAIALPALAAQRFVPPFGFSRMTWIKPSFLWMMYRSGWATKPGQEHVLAIRITRAGFESALAQSCLSHFEPDLYADEAAWRQRRDDTTVRIQWDPERDLDLNPLPWRSLQVGLGPGVVPSYVEDWVVGIDDVTPLAHELRDALHRQPGDLPPERPYPLSTELVRTVGATVES